jgi:DnaJ-domain-containing protein 1
MFDSAKSNNVRALVALTLADGTSEHVSVKLPLSSKLADALNNADRYLDAIDGEGKQFFVAKSAVKRVDLVEVPRASQMNPRRRASDRAHFDPHDVLGVAKGCDADAIRQAYHAMARKYHPDRFAGLDLPKEMRDYAEAMLVRINLAYEQLGG